MDMMLMQTNSTDRDDFKLTKSFSYSPRSGPLAPPPAPPSSAGGAGSRRGNPLKFHLVTTEEHGGYMLSLSPARIRHFRSVLEASGLHKLDSETTCNRILDKSSKTRISKKQFNAAMSSLVTTTTSGSNKNHNTSAMDKTMKTVLQGIFDSFDKGSKNDASAIEVACGFTILCRGKKSDKLEFAFEVLDKNKRGHLSRSDMTSYLQSFLTVLLGIAFSPVLDNDPNDDSLSTMNGMPCERSVATLSRAVKAGAAWATSLAFEQQQNSSMSFDDFASWYTRVGYSSIPWLELLDLQKWAMMSSNNKA